MNRSILNVAAGLTLALAALVTPASAQTGEDDDSPGLQLIKLAFPGGNATEYVAAVKKAAGGVNVFIAPEAREVQMPAIELNNVSVSSALGVLHDRVSLASAGRSVQLGFNEGGTAGSGEEPIYSIVAYVRGNPPSSIAMNRVWSVAGLLKSGVKVDDVLTAIETALELIGKDVPAAQLRFHEATGILMSRATPEQLSAIQDVLDSLEVAAAERSMGGADGGAPAPGPAAELAKSQRTIQQLQDRIAELETQLAKAKASAAASKPN